MTYILTMSSSEYGAETFEYGTREEAEAGQERIKERIAKLDDGIEREFVISGGEAMPKTKPICADCGGDKIIRISHQGWDGEKWIDDGEVWFNCGHCAEDAEVVMVPEEWEPKYKCEDCGKVYGSDQSDLGTVCEGCKRGVVQFVNAPVGEGSEEHQCTSLCNVKSCDVAVREVEEWEKEEEERRAFESEVSR